MGVTIVTWQPRKPMQSQAMLGDGSIQNREGMAAFARPLAAQTIAEDCI